MILAIVLSVLLVAALWGAAILFGLSLWIPIAGSVIAVLAWAGLEDATAFDYKGARKVGIDRMADAVEAHLNVKALLSLLGKT